MSKDIEKYGDIRAEDGKITGAIDLAKSMNMKESEIEDYLVKKFNITKEEAEKYFNRVYACPSAFWKTGHFSADFSA